MIARLRARPRRHRLLLGFHRRISRRKRRRFRGHARSRPRHRLRPGLLVQIQPAARHARRAALATRCRKTVKDERLARLAGPDRRAIAAVQSGLRRPDAAGAVRKAGTPPGPARRAQPLAPAGSRRGAARAVWAGSLPCPSPGSSPTASPESWSGSRRGAIPVTRARPPPMPARRSPACTWRSTTIPCCRNSSARATSIWSASSARSAWRSPRAATAWRSRARLPAPISPAPRSHRSMSD